MNEKLKPCRFCGGNGKLINYINCEVAVKCCSCGYETFSVSAYWLGESEKSAGERVIEAWNRRAESEE